MDISSSSSSQFVVPTIIDVPELIVTRDDTDFDDDTGFGTVWIDKMQFLSSALSYTLGLGNIWRFPAFCYKYSGGAFLIAYTIMLIAVGFPLFLMELAFGQYANEGPITIWRISPAFEGVGYSMCIVTALVATYYNVINSYSLYYLFGSITFRDLPFTNCNNAWNTNNCVKNAITTSIMPTNCQFNNTTMISQISAGKQSIDPIRDSGFQADRNNILLFANNTSTFKPAQNVSSNCTINPYEFEKIISSQDKSLLALPSVEYFHNNLLAISDSINHVSGFNFDQWICLILAWLIILFIINKDFKIGGRSAIFTLIIPYLTLLIIFLRTLWLDGSFEGIRFYLTPDSKHLKNVELWTDALTQVFFSLSPCWGGIITLASMNKFHNNFHSDAMLIVVLNYVTSLLCGLVTFSILGYMADYSGLDIQDCVDKGIGFAFIVYSEGIATMPLANIFAILFFTLMLFLGITNQLTLTEFVINTIVDIWPHKFRYRKLLILIITSGLMCILGTLMCFENGFHIVQIMDEFSGTYTAIFIGLIEGIAIFWVYGIDNFIQDIDDMISIHRNLFPSRAYWSFLWKYLTPSILFAALVVSLDLPLLNYRGKDYPSWTIVFGWIGTLLCISFIPLVALVRFVLTPKGSFHDRISYLCKPSEDWAPSSYVSGPKLLNKYNYNEEYDGQQVYSSRPSSSAYDQDQDSNDSNEDLKFIDGKANYIIPEEDDETETGLVTDETNV